MIWSENSYTKKLIESVDDLLLDLKNNKPLQIDNIKFLKINLKIINF